MSRKLSVRLPDELAERIDKRVAATGRKITDVVVELAAYGLQQVEASQAVNLSDATVTFTSCGAEIESPDVREALEDVAQAGARVLAAGNVDMPTPTRCPACGSKLIPWGPTKRCMNCRRNW